MLKIAVERGWLENDRVVLEALLSFKPAGTDSILAYVAIKATRLLKKD